MKGNRKFVENEAGNAGTVGLLVGVLVVIVIGLLVFNEISSSIYISSATGRAAQSSVNTTAGTVFTLAPIVAIVLIAGIILAVVTKFGGGGGGL